MTEKKNAHPTAPTVGQAVDSGAVCKAATTSTKNFTISAAGSQRFSVADLLPTGQQNAVPLRHLKELVHLPGRELRRLIERERRAGALILSDNQRGYYLAADAGEAQAFIKSMRHRAAEIRLTAAHIERAVRNHGQ